MSHVESLQIVQCLHNLLEDELDLGGSDVNLLVLDDTVQVAFHEIQAKIKNRWFVSGLFVYDFIDVQNVGMVKALQKFDFSESGDGKTKLILVLDVIHLLQRIKSIVLHVSRLENGSIGSSSQLDLGQLVS